LEVRTVNRKGKKAETVTRCPFFESGRKIQGERVNAEKCRDKREEVGLKGGGHRTRGGKRSGWKTGSTSKRKQRKEGGGQWRVNAKEEH